MAYKLIQFSNFNENNPYVFSFVELKDNTYIFTVRWSNYCNCAFLSISDYNDNPIISDRALVNGLQIKNKKLPYIFVFIQINGESYEPTIDNISNEFALSYDDEVLIQ